MHATATWRHGSESVAEDDHGHRVTLDLPADEGGHGAGPSAAELPLLALAGSLTTGFAQVARRHGVPYEGISVAIESEPSAHDAAVSRIHGLLRVRTPASSSQVDAILEAVLKNSPAARLYARAQVPLDVAAVVVAPLVRAEPGAINRPAER